MHTLYQPHKIVQSKEKPMKIATQKQQQKEDIDKNKSKKEQNVNVSYISGDKGKELKRAEESKMEVSDPETDDEKDEHRKQLAAPSLQERQRDLISLVPNDDVSEVPLQSPSALPSAPPISFSALDSTQHQILYDNTTLARTSTQEVHPKESTLSPLEKAYSNLLDDQTDYEREREKEERERARKKEQEKVPDLLKSYGSNTSSSASPSTRWDSNNALSSTNSRSMPWPLAPELPSFPCVPDHNISPLPSAAPAFVEHPHPHNYHHHLPRSQAQASMNPSVPGHIVSPPPSAAPAFVEHTYQHQHQQQGQEQHQPSPQQPQPQPQQSLTPATVFKHNAYDSYFAATSKHDSRPGSGSGSGSAAAAIDDTSHSTSATEDYYAKLVAATLNKQDLSATACKHMPDTKLMTSSMGPSTTSSYLDLGKKMNKLESVFSTSSSSSSSASSSSSFSNSNDRSAFTNLSSLLSSTSTYS